MEAAALRARPVFRNVGPVFGALLTGTLLLLALVSLVWTPYSPIAIDVGHKLATPS
ncbi:MAG: ABC transporter permease, partial [Alphaproteobacteria bacterium]|nr:ABC transporter permease [Alphaproteobacteria bacterium]